MPHVLFDIDGTLVRLDGIGRYALIAAVASLTSYEPRSRWLHSFTVWISGDAPMPCCSDEIAGQFGLVVADIRLTPVCTVLGTALTAQVAEASPLQPSARESWSC